ncbi:MAG: hypothetical protein KJ971_02745 [Firmicutes bacterium]|nr:hypothetical protein [Bacillota bacterium]
MFEELGEFTGGLIIFFYLLTVLNYVLKFITKKFGKTLRKAPKFYKIYIEMMKFIFKNHRLFGLITILLVLTHFVIQFIDKGISVTGLIAASCMFLEAILGSFGAFTKPKKKIWLYIHRGLAIIIFIAIVIHL